MDSFRASSPRRVVEIRRGPGCPDPHGYFVYVHGSLIARHPGLKRATAAYRELMSKHDPPPQRDEPKRDERRAALADEIAASYFWSYNPAKSSGSADGRLSKRKKRA